MRGRTIGLVTLTFGILLAALFADAQPPANVPRIGFLQGSSGGAMRERVYEACWQGLRAHEYVEGQHIVIERRSSEGRGERLPDLVAELVHFTVDVIVTSGPGRVLGACGYYFGTSPKPSVSSDAAGYKPSKSIFNLSLGEPQRCWRRSSSSMALPGTLTLQKEPAH